MNFIGSYFKSYKRQAIIGPLFKLLEAVFELIVPLIVAAIIDKGILQNNSKIIWGYVGLLAVFAVVGYACALCAQYFASYVANNISCSIRADLFKHILKLNMTEYEVIGTSGILTLLTDDINQISNGINLFLRLLLRSPFIVFGACVMACYINFKASLIFLSVVAILGLIIFINMRVTLPLFKKSRTELGILSSKADNGLNGVKTIRSFNKSGDDLNTFKAQNTRVFDYSLKASRISALLNPITYAVINLCVCVLIYYGAIKVDSGILSKGLVVALYNYMSQILVEMLKLSNLVVNVSKSLACLNRVENMFNYGGREANIKDKDFADCADISVVGKDKIDDIYVEFRNVSFIYDKNSDETLKNISFDIRRGEIVGVIGKTGSGKSTLGRVLSGLYNNYTGSIYFDGKELSSLSESDKAHKIGFVTQKTDIITGTIKENILIKRDGISDSTISEAIELSCFEETVNSTSEGINKMLYSGGSGTGLSGGQKQRLGIARVLAGKPNLLILDDSTSALDASTESKFLSNLESMTRRPTTLIISQRIRTVKRCSRILYIDDGEILGYDTHENLYKNLEDYRDFCILQGQEMK